MSTIWPSHWRLSFGLMPWSLAELSLELWVRAFRRGSQETQYSVAVLLLENASKLPGANRVLLWPVIDLDWPVNALPVCRIALVMAAIQCFIVQLQRSRETVPGSAAVLFEALKDNEPQVRNLAVCSLRPFVEAMAESD